MPTQITGVTGFSGNIYDNPSLQKVSADKAESLLQGLRANLFHADGSVKSGVMRVMHAHDPNQTLAFERKSWYQICARKEPAMTRTRQVLETLIERSYGSKINPLTLRKLQQVFASYCEQRYNRIGTRSLATYLETLDAVSQKKLPVDEALATLKHKDGLLFSLLKDKPFLSRDRESPRLEPDIPAQTQEDMETFSRENEEEIKIDFEESPRNNPGKTITDIHVPPVNANKGPVIIDGDKAISEDYSGFPQCIAEKNNPDRQYELLRHAHTKQDSNCLDTLENREKFSPFPIQTAVIAYTYLPQDDGIQVPAYYLIKDDQKMKKREKGALTFVKNEGNNVREFLDPANHPKDQNSKNPVSLSIVGVYFPVPSKEQKSIIEYLSDDDNGIELRTATGIELSRYGGLEHLQLKKIAAQCMHILNTLASRNCLHDHICPDSLLYDGNNITLGGHRYLMKLGPDISEQAEGSDYQLHEKSFYSFEGHDGSEYTRLGVADHDYGSEMDSYALAMTLLELRFPGCTQLMDGFIYSSDLDNMPSASLVNMTKIFSDALELKAAETDKPNPGFDALYQLVQTNKKAAEMSPTERQSIKDDLEFLSLIHDLLEASDTRLRELKFSEQRMKAGTARIEKFSDHDVDMDLKPLKLYKQHIQRILNENTYLSQD